MTHTHTHTPHAEREREIRTQIRTHTDTHTRTDMQTLIHTHTVTVEIPNTTLVAASVAIGWYAVCITHKETRMRQWPTISHTGTHKHAGMQPRTHLHHIPCCSLEIPSEEEERTACKAILREFHKQTLEQGKRHVMKHGHNKTHARTYLGSPLQ